MIKESLLNPTDVAYRETVMAGDYWMKVVKAGQTIRIVDSEGNQAADTLFYSAANPAERYSAVDAVDSVLPAGTLSGAPKIRACQLIDQLEDNKRGIYGGAIGYVDFTGNLDTCIAIRLAFKKGGKVFVRSGAGIVADSIPENEYQECINKAKAVVQALQKAQEMGSDKEVEK